MNTQQIINKYLYALFIALVGLLIYIGLHEFLNAFLGSIVFYALFKNFMYYLTRRKKLKKSISAVIIIFISFIIVILPISLLVGMIYGKAAELAQNPDTISLYIDKLTLRLKDLPLQISMESIGMKAKAAISQNLGYALSTSFDMLGSILMMYFFLYFLLINMNSMEAKIVYYLPFKKSKILLFGKELVDQTYSNAIGVPLVCVAQGIFAYLCFLIAKVPDAGLWAILTGFASIIPLVGTAIIWLPISLFLLADNQIWQGIFVVIYCVIILSNVDNLVRMVVSKRVGDVHPVTTVLGVIIGLQFFGLPGLVFGPLIISYFILLLRLYYLQYISKTENLSQKENNIEPNITEVLLKKIDFFNPLDKNNNKS